MFTKRFIPNGNEAFDPVTGLTWRTCGEPCGEGGSVNSLYSPKQAFKRAKQVALMTGQNWRVPNAKELWSLINPDYAYTIDEKLFKIGENCAPGYHPSGYLTSTPYIFNPGKYRNSYYTVSILVDCAGEVTITPVPKDVKDAHYLVLVK
jgi:hypothetical protein